jgi:hypothetical protein
LPSLSPLRQCDYGLISGTPLKPYWLADVLVWTASHPHGLMALSASRIDERKV